MKNKLTGLMIVFGCLILTGCAATPTQEEIANAYYGEQPTQVFQEMIIKTFMASILKDPDSAKYQFGESYKGYITYYPDTVFPSKTEYGWVIRVSVNAKNSFGGYTGYQLYRFLVRDENIILAYGPDERNFYKEGKVI